MTIETIQKLATKSMDVSTNETHRTVTFRRKGFGHIEATLSKDGATITCRCTPNFTEAGIPYTYNERSYLHPVRFKAMSYNDFRKIVSFLNNTELDGKALPKPEPLNKKAPELEFEPDEEIAGTVAEG